MGWFDSSSFNKEKSNRCLHECLIGTCGACIHLNPNDYISRFFGGYVYKCIQRGSYYPWNESRCSRMIMVNPEKVDCTDRYKQFTGRTFYYVSSMIGLILGKDLNEKPFANIKLLKDSCEENENQQKLAKLYDVYGMLVATGLYFDPNRIDICEALMPILNKVSDLVDNQRLEEALNIYYDMVKMLYNKYSHTISNASDFDYQNDECEMTKVKKISNK